MTLLSESPKTIFIGQSISYPGTGLYDSLTHIPVGKKYEFPVAENLQMGICVGLALKGFIPVSIYPRWNFLLSATDQIVNHLDKYSLMSSGEFTPKVIIRVSIGSENPINPQEQHKGDFSEAFKLMCRTIEIINLKEAKNIIPAYKYALSFSKNSCIIVESADLCKIQ